MSIPTTEQQRINQAQADLNKRRADDQAAVADAQHKLAKAVIDRLAGVPMHGTNVGETAIVVATVLDLLGVKHDPIKPTQSTKPG